MTRLQFLLGATLAASLTASNVKAQIGATKSTAANAPAVYPLGVVVGPAGNRTPTREEQQFSYRWARQSGFNIIESEWMPMADGWIGWSEIETAPGVYNWKAYDAQAADAEAAGLTAMLEVLTWYRVPQWLLDKHPDAYMYTPLGGGDELTPTKRDEKIDTTTLGSMAHPVVIEAAANYAGTLARRYANRPGVRGYIIAEERGIPGVWPGDNYYGIDFSPAMRDAYHAYLRRKYKDIGALNRAWGHPDRYKDFSEIIWRKGWSHDPKSYRGEWFEYYKVLQQAVANFHNRIAKAIKQGDPDARVMVSDYDPLVNRVGHGAYSPLFTEIDEVGYKSYWNDNRMLANYHGGIAGGKDVWITNFSERETTQGGIEQRYLEPRYVRRAFWAAFSQGVKGAFLFVWSPTQAEKMSLFEPKKDGSLETIPAIQTMSQLSDFMATYWKTLSAFTPEAPRVIVHDPNTTFIARHWDFADPKPLREKWHSETPAAQRYHKMVDVLADINRRFTIGTDENIERELKAPGLQAYSLVGCSHLDERVRKAAIGWIESGKTLIIDEDSGRFDEFSNEVNAFAPYLQRGNVIVLKGERWDRDATQLGRINEAMDKKVPLAYKIASQPETAVRISLMNAANGNELAIIDRRGLSGKPGDLVNFTINWQRPHQTVEILDPFAARAAQKSTMKVQGKASTLKLEGYQDALLVIAR